MFLRHRPLASLPPLADIALGGGDDPRQYVEWSGVAKHLVDQRDNCRPVAVSDSFFIALQRIPRLVYVVHVAANRAMSSWGRPSR